MVYLFLKQFRERIDQNNYLQYDACNLDEFIHVGKQLSDRQETKSAPPLPHENLSLT